LCFAGPRGLSPDGPGHVAPIIGAGPDRHAELAVFGLIPPWSRDGKNFRQCYNARSESVADKPSFRHAWKTRHGASCLPMPSTSPLRDRQGGA
jgi:putative SOS response-associated peptidase YedK